MAKPKYKVGDKVRLNESPAPFEIENMSRDHGGKGVHRYWGTLRMGSYDKGIGVYEYEIAGPLTNSHR